MVPLMRINCKSLPIFSSICSDISALSQFFTVSAICRVRYTANSGAAVVNYYTNVRAQPPHAPAEGAFRQKPAFDDGDRGVGSGFNRHDFSPLVDCNVGVGVGRDCLRA